MAKATKIYMVKRTYTFVCKVEATSRQHAIDIASDIGESAAHGVHADDDKATIIVTPIRNYLPL